MKSTDVCKTVGGNSGGKSQPRWTLQKRWKNKQKSQNPDGKKSQPATVTGNPLKPMGKPHFQAMVTKHTSAPSVVRTVESIGDHWKTNGKTSDSLHNHWAPAFRGGRRIHVCDSYRKTLENQWENNVSAWQAATVKFCVWRCFASVERKQYELFPDF